MKLSFGVLACSLVVNFWVSVSFAQVLVRFSPSLNMLMKARYGVEATVIGTAVIKTQYALHHQVVKSFVEWLFWFVSLPAVH
jgi:uncharacterized membrane-anchored protein